MKEILEVEACKDIPAIHYGTTDTTDEFGSILSIERQKTESINFESVVNDFTSLKARKSFRT